jgi:5'-deoxynucleotidase YfbR-like HD superfamily hydrolase
MIYKESVFPVLLLSNGDYLDYIAPDLWEPKIEPIAYGLSNICRFGGQCRPFYSVACHSVVVSSLVPKEYKLQALLHDAAEAFMGDVPSPLKMLIPDYKKIENKLLKHILEYYGCEGTIHPIIKKADLIALATEKRDLLPEDNYNWGILDGIEPIDSATMPLTTLESEKLFLKAFNTYTSNNGLEL